MFEHMYIRLYSINFIRTDFVLGAIKLYYDRELNLILGYEYA